MRSPLAVIRAISPAYTTLLDSCIRLLCRNRFAALLAIAVFTLIIQPNRLASQESQLPPSYINRPLAFELNRGQTYADVKFFARGRGYTVFLTGHEAVLSLNESVKGKAHSTQELGTHSAFANPHSDQLGSVIRIGLENSNTLPTIAGTDRLPGKSNYFSGKDPKRWRSDIPNFARVAYHNVYPGVDLIYYGNQRRLEYDFVIAPGADYRRIRLAVSGAQAIRVDQDGSLVLHTPAGDLRQHPPEIYQELAGKKKTIAGRYVLAGSNQVSFDLAGYDPRLPLTIDPVLDYSTYLGGTGDDFATGIAVDKAGNIYVAGGTRSVNFPISNAIQSASAGDTDVFITKLSADGSTLIYSTYLGGSSFCCVSGGDDSAAAIAVDELGQAYVAGQDQFSGLSLGERDPKHFGWQGGCICG